MKISKVEINKFTTFKNAEFDFCPGVNVLIGRNGTGKSHLLKLLYTTLEAARAGQDVESAHNAFSSRLGRKLAGVFRPDEESIGRLVSRTVGRSKASVKIATDIGTCAFRVTTQGNVHVESEFAERPEPAVFLPSREALAMFEGFIQAYEERQLSFDETYRDLCIRLTGSQLRGTRLAKVAKLVEPLEAHLEGKVRLYGSRFYLLSEQTGSLEAHLLAEGLRKIASLVHLMLNGSLATNGFLFWDEPEANLNPHLVSSIAKSLRQIAAFGVQVFVSTHDYLLTSELSLFSESEAKTKSPVATRFFTLTRDKNDGVIVDQGDTLADLARNPILEEFALHYDRRNEFLSN